MLKNALRDGAEFAWVPNGDTCAFCMTLASRGWQRASKRAIKNGHAEPDDSGMTPKELLSALDKKTHAFNVTLNKPLASGKAILNHPQSCVTTSVRPKAMGGVLKAVLIDGFQQHTDNFLYQLVVNGRNTQRTEFSILLRDICPSGRFGLVGFVFQGCNKPVDSFKAHCVDGFSVCACGHVSLTGINILICP